MRWNVQIRNSVLPTVRAWAELPHFIHGGHLLGWCLLQTMLMFTFRVDLLHVIVVVWDELLLKLLRSWRFVWSKIERRHFVGVLRSVSWHPRGINTTAVHVWGAHRSHFLITHFEEDAFTFLHRFVLVMHEVLISLRHLVHLWQVLPVLHRAYMAILRARIARVHHHLVWWSLRKLWRAVMAL